MAGIKITDLTALATAAADDYLCIVDVNDTTQSPAGTTKKIEVSNLNESGTFAPTFSGATGAITTANGPDGFYSRIGNVVSLTFAANVDFDFSISLTGQFQFTLPISTLGVGYGTVTTDFGGNINGYILNDQVFLNTDDNTLTGSTVKLYCTMQYLLL